MLQHDLAPGSRVLLEAFAAHAAWPPAISVAEWAAAERVVSAESGSPHPGKWDNARVPYLVEVMETLSLSHPARDVVLRKSAQVGGSECGINLFGYIASSSPAPMLIVLPSIEESLKYNRVKLSPAIEATPSLRKSVAEQKSRDGHGSTTVHKRFRGGFCVVTGANSSKGLQMVSARVIIFEEVSEYPFDADGRGDPIDQAMARNKAWSASAKRFYCSTPGVLGMCRITDRWELSDQRRYYVPCPHCGGWQTLEFERMRGRDAQPFGAHFDCLGCGAEIGHQHKRAMVAQGRWVRAWGQADAADLADRPPPELIAADEIDAWAARGSGHREPGFSIWQAYSPFVSWDDTWRGYLESKGDPHKEKVFTQQTLGRAWEARGEAPDSLKLFARREAYSLGTVPSGGLFCTLGADVQHDRIEWAAWAWGIGKARWIVDRGIVSGDTGRLETYDPLRDVFAKKYPLASGYMADIEFSAIDTGDGTRTQAIYAFVRNLGNPRVMAIKGMPGNLAPALGTPSKQDVNFMGVRIRQGIRLWPVGTWGLKAAFYAGMRGTIEGPNATGQWPGGTVHLSEDLDESYIKQLVAETLVEKVTKKGAVVKEWYHNRSHPNEGLDCAIYAHAAAVHAGLDRMSADDWAKIASDRGVAPVVQADLESLWVQPLVPPAGNGVPAAAEPVRASGPAKQFIAPRRDWFKKR
jgi:phage terminase large subunit GpA-like protein